MKPFFDCLKELGAPAIWRDIRGFRHEPTYMQTEMPAIWAWMQKTRRDPDPKRVVWFGTPNNTGRVHWLDVIVRMDGVEIANLADLRSVLGKKKHGDAFTVAYRRGEETVEKEGKLPEAKPRPGLRRTGLPCAGIEIAVEGNRFEARASRVASFELYLSSSLVALAKPVAVVVNGETLHDAPVKPDLSWMIDQALRDRDRTMVYTARLRIDVPPSEPKAD
jgi:hypothetical protein